MRLQNISWAYEERSVITNFSLDIGKRDCILLQGKNGAGKSTIVKLMLGLLIPQAGKIERTMGLTIGYLPQYRQIDRNFPITVFDIVRSGLQSQLRWWQKYTKLHHAQTEHILEELRLEDLSRRPIAALSGGQWQRTLLARALVSNPQLLVLDEPDAHLDSKSKQELYALLAAQHQQRSVVLVTHDEHAHLPTDLRVISM